MRRTLKALINVDRRDPDRQAKVVAVRHSALLKAARATKRLWQAETVVAMPWVDHARAHLTAQVLAKRAGAPMLLLAVQDDLGTGPVKIWNDVLACTASPLFGYVADDAFPGRGWLHRGVEKLHAHPGCQLLAFNDGKWFGQLAGFGLVRRPWLESIYGGTLFHPGYRQHFGDTELSLIAWQQSALIYDPHAILVEIDPDKDGKPVLAADRDLFNARKSTGFEGRVSDAKLLEMFG